MIRIAINGLRRIGRLVVRFKEKKRGFELKRQAILTWLLTFASTIRSTEI